MHVVILDAEKLMDPNNSNVNGPRRTVPQLPLPLGFRFQPTDEELVWYYLKKKAESESFHINLIAEVDLYKSDPWDLPGKALFGEKEWYFFSPRDRKYPRGARPNRAAANGFWKATGTDKPILKSTLVVGVKKSLVFYKGRPPRGEKTDWIMHEYRLKEGIAPSAPHHSLGSQRLDDWVLCRIKKKHSSSAAQGPPGMGNDHTMESMFSAHPEMEESLRTDSEDHVADTSMQLADTSTSSVATFPAARMAMPSIPPTNAFQQMSTSGTVVSAWNHASSSYCNNVGFVPEFASLSYLQQEQQSQPMGGQFLAQNSASFECQRPHSHVGNGSGDGGGIVQDSLFPYDFDDHAGMGGVDSFGYGQNPFS